MGLSGLSGLSGIHGTRHERRVLSVLPANLIGYWPMQELSGTTATDVSGNSRNGAYGNVTLGAAGLTGRGRAVSYNGSTSKCSIYSTPLRDAFDPTKGGVCVWAGPDSADVWTDTVARYLVRLYADNNNQIQIYSNGEGRLMLTHRAGEVSQTYSVYVNSAAPLSAGLTWDTAADEVRAYINGVQVGQTLSGLGTWAGTISIATIGCGNTTPISVWSGRIAHACLYAGATPTPQQMSLLGMRGGWNPSPLTITETATNAAAPLTIPTYDESGQVVHPDVYDAGEGQTWNGHRYWMAMTPYPDGNDAYENPSIVVSEDGDTWTVPQGLTNPIVAKPADGHNADPDIVLLPDGQTMAMFCMQSDDTTFTRVYVTTSTDGVTWAEPTLLLTGVVGQLISPAVLWDGSQYVMWTISRTVTPCRLDRRTAAAVTGPWSDPVICALPLYVSADANPWHIDVIHDADGYLMFLCSMQNNIGRLYLARSRDGILWQVGAALLLEASAAGWDDGRIYRASGVRTATGYDLWYSAVGTDAEWHVGRTTVSA
jgi:hypothetical protein